MKKRILSLFLAVSLVLSLTLSLAPAVHAAEAVDSGTWGDNLSWSLDDQGLLTVGGQGAMLPKTNNMPYPWQSYAQSVTGIVVEEGVVSLGASAFSGFTQLEQVKLPESLETIGAGAFYGCTKLEQVRIPQGVTRINTKTFYDCISLTRVELPDTLTYLGNSAFYGCSALTSIRIPAALNDVDSLCFSGCKALKRVDISDLDAWTRIDFESGSSNPLNFAHELFLNGEPVTRVVFPEGTAQVPLFVFEECTTLEEVVLPDSVTSIGQGAFYRCVNLKKIRFSAGLTHIGDHAFFGDSALEELELPQGLVSIGNNVFLGAGGLKELRLPEGLQTLGAAAFMRCGALEEVYIPASLKAMGKECFDECGSLEKVHISDLSAWCALELQNYWANPLINGASLYLNGERITDLVIPQGVTEIADSVFYMGNFDSITIPEGVVSIGNLAFASCTGVEGVTVPQSVTRIGEYAFAFMPQLRYADLPQTLTELGTRAFAGCALLERISLPEGLTNVPEGAFFECETLTDAVISAGVTKINAYAFAYTTQLRSVRIPAGVTAVDDGAFLESGLQTVYFSGSQAQWKAITVGTDNEALKGAKIYYNCDQWQDLVDMGYTLEQILTQPSLVINPTCDRELIHSLENVTVTSALGQVAVSGRYSLPLEVAIEQDLIIRADGYRDYIIPRAVAATMKRGSDGTFEPYAFNAVMQLDRKDGKPYISSVFIRETGSGLPYKDARVTEYYAAKGTQYDLVVTSVGMEGKAVTYYIGQNEHNRIESTTGRFTAQELTAVFDYGKKLYVYAEATDGTVCEPVELKLAMIMADDYAYAFLNSSTFSLFGDDGLKLKVGDSLPILGGLEVGMDCFSAPIGVDITGNRVRVSIGFDIFSVSKEDAQKAEVDHLFKSFKKEFKGIAGHLEDQEKALQRFKALKQKYGGKPFETGKRAFNVEFMGYLEGEIVNGELIFTEGLVSIAGKFSTSHTRYALLGGWFPVYIAAGFDGSVRATGTAARVVADEKVPVDFGITLDVVPELWLEGGVGIRKVMSIGVYGKGGAPYHVNFSEKYHKWKLTGELGIRASFLLWHETWPLLDGEFVLLEEYYGATPADLGPIAIGDPQASAVEMADRDYLEYDSGWLGQAADGSLFADELSAVDFRILQTGIYEEAKPQLTKVGSSLVLTWIEDDPSRDDFNRMRLVYSVYDPASGNWSDPKPVYDDGCLDANATTAVVDGKLVIAWQKLARAMTAEDFTGVEALLQNAEIYVAVYDPATDSVESVQRITENETFDYLPVAAAVAGQPAVYYVSCADNDLLGSSHAVRLWTAGQESVLADGISFVHTADAEASRAAWITDSGVSVWDGTLTLLSGSATALVFAQDGLYLTDGGNLYTCNGTALEPILAENRTVGGNLAAVNVGSGLQLYWMETEETGNALYRVSRVGDTWSKPVRVSTQAVSVSCVDVAFYEDQVMGACQLTDGDGITALACFAVHDVTNIALDNWFYFDESQVTPGSDMCVDVTVSNLGTTDIAEITFTVTDTLGTNHTYSQPVTLLSGDTETVTVTYTVPENFTATTLKITAAVEHDADTSDNSVSMDVGECDLSVGLISQESIAGKYLITAEVRNDSALPAENVRLTVTVDGQEARTLSLGTLSGGQQASVQVQLDALALDFGADGAAKAVLTLKADTLLSYTDDDALSVTLLRPYNTCEHPRLGISSVLAPTCLERGYTVYSCVSCGNTVVGDYVDALGHDHVFAVTAAPTEQAEGILTADCSRCDDGYTVALPVISAEHYSYSIVTEPTYTQTGLGRYTWLETAYGPVYIDIILPEIVAPAQRLELVSAPEKLYYSLGEAFDPAGMLLRLHRQDGETELLTQLYSISGFDSETAGRKTVTVSYEAVSVSFTVLVSDGTGNCGQCGDNAWWIYEPDSLTLTIFGTGAMYDWSGGYAVPWADARWDMQRVTVEEGITHIGKSAFHGASEVLQVQLPESVTSIGYQAFMGCYGLKSISLPQGLTEISGSAFANTGLESVEIPQKVTRIGGNAFSSSAQLKTVTVGERVEKIDSYAFSGCTALERIELPQSLTSIGSYCFRNCDGLTEISIPAGVTYLGSYALFSCDSLEEVTVGEGLTTIKDNTFSSCAKLRSITLPASLKTVQTNAFVQCTSLSQVHISDLKAWCNVTFTYATTSTPYSHPFNACTGSLYLNGEKLTRAVLPEGLTQLKAATFYNCAGLETLVIPEGVKSLAQDCLRSCPDLKEVTLPASLQIVESYFLKDCPRIEKVHITDIAKWCAVQQRGGGVLRYGGRLYLNQSPLLHLEIPEGVTYIQSYAFRGSDIASISIPASLKTVSTSAFEGCGQLWHIFYEGTAEQWAQITVNSKNDPLTQAVRHDGVYESAMKTAMWGSCTQYGEQQCTLCGASKIMEKQNSSHALTWQMAILPGEKANGVVKIFCEHGDYSTYASLPMLSAGVYIRQVLREATCTEPGLNNYGVYLSEYDLGVIFEAESPALGHTETAVVTPATCTEGGFTTYRCSVCGETRTGDEVSALGHSETAAVTPATCTEDGFTTYTCDLCGETRIADAVSALGHFMVTDPAVVPSCTEGGLSEGSHCQRCGTVEVAQRELAPLGHSWFLVSETQPTEYEDGFLFYRCHRCRDSRTVILPALGHTHEYLPETVFEPSCTDEGYTVYTCRCGDSYLDDYTPALGHSPVTDPGFAPGCTAEGLTDGSHCDRCSAVLEAAQPIPATGHSPVTDPAVAPTCTEPGLTEGSHCAVCGEVLLARVEVQPLGHSWDGGTVIKEPTELFTGIRLYTCTACGKTREEVIPTVEHVHFYSSVIHLPGCTTIGFTAYSCACGHTYNDQYRDPLGHLEISLEGVEPTCTEPGLTEGSFCDRCMEILIEQEEIPAPGHSWDEGTVIREPTEEAEGLRLYTCHACGEKREEGIPKLEHVHRYESIRTESTCAEQGFITQICSCGHSYVSQLLPMPPHELVEQGYKEPTCTEAGYTGDLVCSVCGELQELGSEMEARGHEYWRIDTAPTCTEEGFSTYTCDCGESYTDEYVPALGHSLSDWILTGSGQIYRTCFGCGNDEIMEALPTVTDPNQAIVLAVDVLEKHTYEITMTDPVWGNVVCIAQADGSYTVLPETQITDTGVRVTLPGSCRIIVVNRALTFPDVGANNRFRKDADYLTARGIMSGKLDGTYGLSEHIQRRTVAMVLWRLAGEPQVEGKSPFPDVTGGRYLMPVLWAYQNGIITGYTDGTFRPTDTISRQHFAVMLHRYAKWANAELERSDNGKLEDFPDYAAMNRRFYEDMQWALDCGLITGKANGNYDPVGFTTRGQMTTVLSRFLQKLYASQD